MNEEAKVTEVEEKKLSVQEKGLLIVGGVITIATIGVSYKLGSKALAYKIELGLENCFKHDPTLESHMKKVLGEVTSEMKKK